MINCGIPKNNIEYNFFHKSFSAKKRSIQQFSKTKGNYLNTNKIIFDYGKCIKNIDLEEKNKIELRKLWEFYKRRKGLLKKKKQEYYTISRILTKKILEAN